MKKKKLFGFFLLALLTAASQRLYAQTTYKLVKVTNIEAGEKYVFSQSLNGKNTVMKVPLSSKGIQIETSYQTAELTGNETYVWTLESATNGKFYIKTYNDQYLHNASSTNLSLQEKSKSTTAWTFFLQDDGNTFLIKNELVGEYRFLGYSSSVNLYKAYKYSGPSDLTTTPGNITVYQLIEEKDAENVTITKAGMATYVSKYDLDYSGVSGMKAYKAKVSGNTVTFTSVGEVPAGEGVLLKADDTLTDSKAFSIPVATTAVEAWAADDNDFIAGQGNAVPSVSGDNYNYILNEVGGEVGFYKANDKKVATNRAYLSTTSAPDPSSPMMLSFDDGTTGIEEIGQFDNLQSDNWYDLQGRKIVKSSNGQMTKGLYIVNGKKILIQ